MAIRLSGAELARMKTDFDAPSHVTVTDIPQEDKTVTVNVLDAEKKEKKHTGKGNPHGRPPSKNPRKNHLHIMLSDDDAAKLTEAARLLDTDKTKIIVKGINRIFDEAAAEAWKRTSSEFKEHGRPTA